MSRLGDLLELMHTAHARLTTGRAVYRERADPVLWHESARRWAEQGERGSRAILVAARADEPTGGMEERLHRVWHDAAGPRWRVETEGAAQHPLTIIDGKRWWLRQLQGGDVTNLRPDASIAENVGGGLPSRFLELVFDPASLLYSTALEPAGEERFAGRTAIAALAHWRPGISLIDIEWPYADEIRLAVDGEFGVLLRLEFYLDGQPFIRWHAEEFVAGEAISPSLFAGLPDAKLPDVADVLQEHERLREQIRHREDESKGGR